MDTVNYFVSESDLPEQTSDQAYGPMTSSQYRVTSLFSSENNLFAYAVASGSLIIVNQVNNSDRVNLILMPDNLIYGIKAKYFVYRGLIKGDFLDKNNSYIGIRPSDSDDSDLIKKIRKGQNGELALNLYDDLNTGTAIEDVFLSDQFQFASVNQGDSLGRFDSSKDFGFEIMLDEVFFTPTLLDAKIDINIIDLSTAPGQEEIGRLNVINYIDPAAYYGLFTHPAFSVGTNNSTGPTSRKSSDLYLFIKNFFTKNLIYIDIRDYYQQPMDWFEDSPQNLKLTTDGNSALDSVERSYRGGDQFPVNILTDDFSNSQTSESGQTYFVLTLSLSTINNIPAPIITLHAGYWLKFASAISDDMILSVCSDNSGWTDDKKFTIFNVNDEGNEVPIATYLRLELGSCNDATIFDDQIPNNTNINDIAGQDENENYIGFYTIGLFPYHSIGLTEYQEPLN